MTTYNEVEMWLSLKASNFNEFVENYDKEFPQMSKEQFVYRIVRLWNGKQNLNRRVDHVKNKYENCKTGRLIAMCNGMKSQRVK